MGLYKQIQNIKGIIKLKETLTTLNSLHCFLIEKQTVELNASAVYVIGQLFKELFDKDMGENSFYIKFGPKTRLKCKVYDGKFAIEKMKKTDHLFNVPEINVPFVFFLLKKHFFDDLDKTYSALLANGDFPNDVLGEGNIVVKYAGKIYEDKNNKQVNMVVNLETDPLKQILKSFRGSMEVGMKIEEALILTDESKERALIKYEGLYYEINNCGGLQTYAFIPLADYLIDLDDMKIGEKIKFNTHYLLKKGISIKKGDLLFTPYNGTGQVIGSELVGDIEVLPLDKCGTLTRYGTINMPDWECKCEDTGYRKPENPNKLVIYLHKYDIIDDDKMETLSMLYPLEIVI